jgi:hypothetical protein
MAHATGFSKRWRLLFAPLGVVAVALVNAVIRVSVESTAREGKIGLSVWGPLRAASRWLSGHWITLLGWVLAGSLVLMRFAAMKSRGTREASHTGLRVESDETPAARPRIVNPHVCTEQYRSFEVFHLQARETNDFWLRLAVAYIGNQPLNSSSLDAEASEICAKVLFEPIGTGSPTRIRYEAWFAFDSPFISFGIAEEHRLIVASQDTRNDGPAYAVYYERIGDGPYERRLRLLEGEEFKVTAQVTGQNVDQIFTWRLKAEVGKPIAITQFA